MRRLWATVVALALATVLVAACGVNDSGSAERITPGLGLDDTAPTTTSSTTTTSPSRSTVDTLPATTTTTPVQTESVQLWFISGTTLNPITTSLTSPASLDQVIAALQKGTADLGPAASTLRTAVPGSPRLSAMDNGNGTATVELPGDFFGTIPQGADQRLAIGQIVLTLTLRPGIGGVKFATNGEDVAVILGNGEQSLKGQPVTRADYRALTGEAPPSPSSTSTAAGTTSTVAAAAETTVAS